jgi:hypothetical protein
MMRAKRPHLAVFLSFFQYYFIYYFFLFGPLVDANILTNTLSLKNDQHASAYHHRISKTGSYQLLLFQTKSTLSATKL